MTAIKNWFLEKNHMMGWHGRELSIVKETEKAVLMNVTIDGTSIQHWIPKSCICESWEKDTTASGYRAYLLATYRQAFDEERRDHVIKSGRNAYRWDAFIHQLTNKDLMSAMDKHNKAYMSRTEWNNREEA